MKMRAGRLGTVVGLLTVGGMVVVLWGLGCADPEGEAKAADEAMAKGTRGIMEYINAAPTVPEITSRCLAVKDDILTIREEEFEEASKKDDPDSAIGDWASLNGELTKVLGKCPKEMDPIRKRLPELEKDATAKLDEAKLVAEMAGLVKEFEESAGDRDKALTLLTEFKADKRRMDMRSSGSTLQHQLILKYVEVHPTGKLKMGMSGDDVKKVLAGEPATTTPVEGTRAPDGADVETTEWTYPDAGIDLVVIQGGVLKRLVVRAPYDQMLYGVKVGDDAKVIHAALALPDEAPDGDKIRLVREPLELVELFVWPEDGKVAKVTVAGKGFIPYAPPAK